VLSDEILEGLEKLDELQAQTATGNDNLAKAKEELERVKKRVGEQQSGLETEMARVLEELAQAETVLPEDFKREYQRMTKARGDQAMAQVEGECCGGCFQVLTPQTMNELYMAKPIFCKSCGCLLYLPEELQRRRK